MQVESSYSTSQLIGSGPYGKTEIHRKEVDLQGHEYYTVETHPFFSYAASGKLEAAKELGKNIDKLV